MFHSSALCLLSICPTLSAFQHQPCTRLALALATNDSLVINSNGWCVGFSLLVLQQHSALSYALYLGFSPPPSSTPALLFGVQLGEDHFLSSIPLQSLSSRSFYRTTPVSDSWPCFVTTSILTFHLSVSEYSWVHYLPHSTPLTPSFSIFISLWNLCILLVYSVRRQSWQKQSFSLSPFYYLCSFDDMELFPHMFPFLLLCAWCHFPNLILIFPGGQPSLLLLLSTKEGM